MKLTKGQKITIYGTRPRGYSFKQEVTVAEDFNGEPGTGFCYYRHDTTGKKRPMRFTKCGSDPVEEVIVEGWDHLDVDADCYHKAKGNGHLCLVGSVEEVEALLKGNLNTYTHPDGSQRPKGIAISALRYIYAVLSQDDYVVVD